MSRPELDHAGRIRHGILRRLADRWDEWYDVSWNQADRVYQAVHRATGAIVTDTNAAQLDQTIAWHYSTTRVTPAERWGIDGQDDYDGR